MMAITTSTSINVTARLWSRCSLIGSLPDSGECLQYANLFTALIVKDEATFVKGSLNHSRRRGLRLKQFERFDRCGTDGGIAIAYRFL